MGKIRSTLDIVMEKTKNLSMTQDDKRNIRHKELADLARALVQKYADARMTLQDAASELDASGQERAELLGLVRRDLLESLQIDGDNGRVLDALKSLCGMDREKVKGQVQGFRQKLDGEMTRLLAELKSDLEARGVRGSAVIPNISRSRAWQDTLTRAQQVLADELDKTL